MLSGGDPVLHYPYLWPDSFDWIANALYYLEVYVHAADPKLPSLRQPLFVLVVALMYLLDQPWLILVFCQVMACLTVLMSMSIARLTGISRVWEALLGLILATHYSFNMFRLHIMADQLCVFLFLLAVYYYLKAWDGKGVISKFCIYASISSGLSGATQFFGFLPALIFAALLGWYGLRRRSIHLILAGVMCASVAYLPQLMWNGFKVLQFGSAGKTKVQHFELLGPSWDMAVFYLNLWPVIILPWVAALVAAYALGRTSKPTFNRFVFQYLGLLVFVSFLLVSNYQWKESRFACFFEPIIGLFIMSIISAISEEKIPLWKAAIIYALSLYISLSPANHLMRPGARASLSILFHPKKVLTENYLVKIFKEERVGWVCGNKCLVMEKGSRKFIVPEGCYRYRYSNLAGYLEYQKRVGRSRRKLCRSL